MRKAHEKSTFLRVLKQTLSLNHRFSRFGFFAHPALTAANEVPSGNYRFLDQMAALRWINRNIAAFGGDPN